MVAMEAQVSLVIEAAESAVVTGDPTVSYRFSRT
jgi:hypothetical protein